MELKQLEAFVGVADCKSFSLAAERLYLTQPTVSAHIASLEGELGTKLFDRTTRYLKLTAAGEQLYPYAVRMLELKSTALTEIASPRKFPLVIGASSVPGTYLLPEILMKFSAEHNDVPVRIKQGNSTEIEELVADGAAELGIIGQEPVTKGLTVEYLCTDELVLVTPVNEYYTGLRAENTNIERLLEEPLLLREDGSGTLQFVEKVLKIVNPDKGLNIYLRANNQETIKRMILAGAGVSIMSRYAAADIEEANHAYCYPVGITEDRSFYIIYKSGRDLRNEAAELIRLAHTVFT